MEDFLMRTISAKSEDGLIKVTRTRTSAGYASIKISFKDQDITIANDNNAGYEQQALNLAKVITKVAQNPCNLPRLEGND